MQTIDTKLVNFFNSYLFRNVWNEPTKEYRRNIKPKLVSTPIANTNVKLYWKRYDLPTAEKYQVYFIPESNMGGLTFKDFPDWTNCVDFLNSSRVELRFHNNDGITLPREKVFVVNHPDTKGVLIAVKRSLFRDIYGASADYTDLFVGIYFDSDMPNDVEILTYTLDGGTDVNTVYNATLNATVVYVNGVATQVNNVADISIANATVEIVTDNNVVGEFAIDLTTADGQRNFNSTLDGNAKTIIHIPKSINPNNKVITHHTCDLWIYPRNGANNNRNGRFLHRAIEDFTFTQITHNDFAVPNAIINSYMDTLNTDALRLVIQVKEHSKNNTLITDVNYINLLYTHDDNVILDFLEGNGPEDFEFWKAEVLESSEYARMMVDTPDFIDVSNLPQYIGALGYYNSIALISNRVRTITLEEVEGVVSHRFVVPIPIVFESIRIFPSLFVNGVRLQQNMVSVNKIVSGSVVIDVHESVELLDGDVVKVELFEDVPHNIREVRPTATYNHIDVADDDFVLYEITTPAGPVDGVGETYDHVYVRIDDISTVGAYVNSIGGRYIAFNPSSYDRSFVLVHNVGFEYKSYNLDPLLETNQPLAFDLTTTIKAIDFEPPYVWSDHVSKDSASGEVVDPLDPNAEEPNPAWNVMDGDETWDSDKRWITTLIPEGNKVRFNLDPSIQGNYYLIGYRIGAMPNMNDAYRASVLPINWQVRVDGALTDSVSDEWWYLNPEVIHTHMLLTPVQVNSQIEFSLLGVQTNGAFQIQTDMFEPIFSDAIENTIVPYLGNLTCIPYLNGRELVKDIDYYLADIQYDNESEPHMCGRQLVINNAAYLEEENNTLEVMLTYCDVEGKTEGYVENEYLDDPNEYPRWFDQLSILSVEGEITENTAMEFGTIKIELPADNARLGSPYGTRTLIPAKSKYFIDRYYSDGDTPKLDALTAYFRGMVEDNPVILLPYSHRLVSIRAHMIVRDMIEGSLVVPYDPSDQVILDAVSDYDYLKQYDVLFNDDSAVDLDYIDFQAMYTEQDIQNGTLLQQITRVIQVLLVDSATYLRPDQEG